MALFTCSKCNKRLGFDGLNVLCVCVDCGKSFCVDEGTIFKNADIYTEIAKGTNDRIINDFLCYDCDKNRGSRGSGKFKPRTNEEIRREAERKQDAEIAKREQEAIKAELAQKQAEAQRIEASVKAEQEKQQAKERAELEKQNQEHSARLIVPNFIKAEIKIEFGTEIKPCSGYLDLYGERGAEATEIFLSVYYEEVNINQGIKNIEIETTQGFKKFYCYECGKLASEKISKITQINIDLLQDKVKKKLREIYNNREKSNFKN